MTLWQEIKGGWSGCRAVYTYPGAALAALHVIPVLPWPCSAHGIELLRGVPASYSAEYLAETAKTGVMPRAPMVCTGYY